MAETIDVLEAARRLGVTPDAVRARLRRGTLEGYRDNSGNWRIVSNDTTADTTRDAMPEPPRHDVVSPDLARLLKALLERLETDQARLIEERTHLQDKLQEARAEADNAKSDQVRMAQDVAGMFDELRVLAEKHTELHVDQARLGAELERARQDADRQRTDHAAELERVRDELDRARQDAGLWREEADRERARIANLQADAEHTEREMTRLQMELEQA